MSLHHTHGIARRTLAILATGSLLTGGLAAATAAQASAATNGHQRAAAQHKAVRALDSFKAAGKNDKLGHRDRQRLAVLLRKGDQQVTILVATKKGETAAVAKQIRAAGGYIRYRADKLNYLSAVVKTKKVTSTSKLAAVRAVDLDETLKIPDQPARASPRDAVHRPRRLDAGQPTPTCRPRTPGPSTSRRRTRRGTGAASPSASSTPASTSTTRR